MNYLIAGVAISTVLLLSACGGSSGNDNSKTATSRIAGLWDATDTDGVSGEDIYYFQIFADGRMESYDYQQDKFNAGDNCYIIEKGDVLTSIGGNQYRYKSEIGDFPDDTRTLTITRSGNILTISVENKLDENGDSTETLTSTYPLLTGVDPVFNECL